MDDKQPPKSGDNPRRTPIEFEYLPPISPTRLSDYNTTPVMEIFDDNECKEKGIHTFRFTEEDILRSEILKFIVNKLENNPIK